MVMRFTNKVFEARVTGLAALAAASLFAAAAWAQGGSLPFDTPTPVNGVETVCSGVAVSDEDAARWAQYPVKIVLAGKGGQFLGNAVVTVSKGGKAVTTVACPGPWTLLRLAPGRYDVSGTIEGEIAKGTVYAPATGQGRVILRFNRGGALSPQYTPPMK
jgi:hypothetical protein